MIAVATWWIGVTTLYAAGLLVDALMAGRRPLVAGAVWNAVLVASLVIGPAVWLLPRWELAVLPAEVPVALDTGSLDTQPAADDTIAEFAPTPSPAAVREMPVVRVPTGLVETATKDRSEHAVWWVNGRAMATSAIAAVYLGGMGILIARLLMNVAAVARLRHRAVPVTCELWGKRLGFWRQRIGLQRPVAILWSEAAQVPVVLGWWRPAIVIPELLVGCQNRQTVDAVLVHELAHVQRADCGWQLVEHVVRTIYWFHPLLWLASRQMAVVRERACDDLAIHLLADRDAYAETLLAMAEQIGSRQRLGLAMAVVRSSKLEKRLATIATSAGNARVHLDGFARGAIISVLLAIAVAGTAVRLVRAAADPDHKSVERGESSQPQTLEPGQAKSVASVPAKSIDLEEYSFDDHTKEKFPQSQRDMTRKFYAVVLKQEYEKAAELFSPELREALPEARLKGLLAALEEQFGRLRARAMLYEGRIGHLELPELFTIWGRGNYLSIRLLFDKEDRIDGLWIGRNTLVAEDDQPPIKLGLGDGGATLTGDAISFGAAMQNLTRQANLSLTVNLVDAGGNQIPLNGKPPQAFVSFFRALNENDPAQKSDHWQDTVAGIRWRRISNESSLENRAERLAPGSYRAFVIGVKSVGYQLSAPITLDGTQLETTVDMAVQPGATVIVTLVDETTGAPVTGADVRLESDDPRLPSYRHGGDEFEDSKITFADMLPGRHRISAHRQVAAAGERGDYEQVESPQYVQLEAGKTVEVTVRLRAKPMTSEESARRWPFVVTGSVLDGDGKPIAGAEVRAMCGIGTLRQTGSTKSDAKGNYRLQFGPGYWSPDGTASQVAVVSASKEGYFEKNLGVQGQLMIADELPPEAQRGEQMFVLPHTPHEVKFVLVPAARVTAEFVDAQAKVLPEFKVALAGKQLPPASSVLADGKTDDRGEYRVDQLPVGYAFWWWHDSRGEAPSRSLPFALPRAGEYRMRVQLIPEVESGLHKLVLLQVLDPAGRDVTGEVMQDDLLQRDPLNAEGQRACQEFVDKMLRANRLWLAPPADDIQYRFELQFDAIGDDRRMAFEHPGSIPPTGRHGVMYASPLAALGNAKNVVYRALEVKPGKAVLAYTFKQPARIAAGNGVDTMWRGSITAASREGILTLDTSSFVPLKVEGDRLVEHFDGYREVTAGQFVPQRVRIDVVDAKDFAFDWSFAVYEPGIWMFEESRHLRQSEAPPVVKLKNLQVNGVAAKRIP